MKLLYFFIIIFLSFTTLAETLKISNVKIITAFKYTYPSTVYLTIENSSNELDYLIGAELLEHPKAYITINKTVVEKKIARIININQLAIPANSTVTLSPLGIYLIIKNLDPNSFNKHDYKIKFFFKKTGTITYSKQYK